MKPESLTSQIMSLANSVAHRKLLGDRPATAAELAEASIQSLLVVAAILDTLDVEQRQRVLEKLNTL